MSSRDCRGRDRVHLGNCQNVLQVTSNFKKKTKKKFLELVKECFSPAVIDIGIARSSSRRSRQYMLMYSAVDKIAPSQQLAKKTEFQDLTSSNEKMSNPTSYIQGDVETHLLYEKSVKLFKTHRSIADSDTAIVTRMARIENKLKKEIGENRTKQVKDVVQHMNVL